MKDLGQDSWLLVRVRQVRLSLKAGSKSIQPHLQNRLTCAAFNLSTSRLHSSPIIYHQSLGMGTAPIVSFYSSPDDFNVQPRLRTTDERCVGDPDESKGLRGGACSEEGFIYLLLSYILLITALGSTAQNKPHTTVM